MHRHQLLATTVIRVTFHRKIYKFCLNKKKSVMPTVGITIPLASRSYNLIDVFS